MMTNISVSLYHYCSEFLDQVDGEKGLQVKKFAANEPQQRVVRRRW